MPVIHELSRIREILNHQCNIIYKVPFMVNNYKEVLIAWREYKKNKSLSFNKTVCDVFDFHTTSCDHIILYWSANMNDCLLMCKVQNKYINIKIPMLIENAEESFIATYT
tara:strand:+ start:123 stop:452 length:330 start_codon:yes stop_codon:yes gene_type:complete